jgi:HTH-type transcriptional regulator/antitoxin HipB
MPMEAYRQTVPLKAYLAFMSQEAYIAAMDYPIQSPAQLPAHLRALRKARGMSQLQLGAALGVGQTRVTRIEHDPAAISVEQFLQVLAALGVQMVLRAPGPTGAARSSPAARRPSTNEPW